MFNDLIGKNKELGRFLFCERYTLPPVKNAMYIAEGQDLKRGAVVDVNGVLVGTNSLMPYAVLEFDCDTRSGGKEASVFIKGEFNFDKLTFASGLSKSDLDNIVYNGSGLGIVIKPYAFDKEFSPKSNGDSGYKQVNLTFGQDDGKTIPVGQKEEVHAACTMKAGDNVIIQLAQDCTDAILLFERTNNRPYRSLTVMRGTTPIKYYGGGLVGKISTSAYPDSDKVMLTTYTKEGDHCLAEPAPPTDFSEVTLANTDELLSIVDHWKVKELMNGTATGTWLFVVKGSYVMCLPE